VGVLNPDPGAGVEKPLTLRGVGNVLVRFSCDEFRDKVRTERPFGGVRRPSTMVKSSDMEANRAGVRTLGCIETDVDPVGVAGTIMDWGYRGGSRVGVEDWRAGPLLAPEDGKSVRSDEARRSNGPHGKDDDDANGEDIEVGEAGLDESLVLLVLDSPTPSSFTNESFSRFIDPLRHFRKECWSRGRSRDAMPMTTETTSTK